MSKRLEEWKAFSEIVEQHIENYTVKQWGDKGEDQATGFTPEQCFDSIQRYINRRNSNRRGDLESFRDLVKIAHYTCMIFEKKIATLPDETAGELVTKIEEGEV